MRKGARCFARFANKVAGAEGKISFETPAGVISAELAGDLVTLQMTEPTDLRVSVPLQIGAEKKIVHFINSGVPHVVVPVAQVERCGCVARRFDPSPSRNVFAKGRKRELH